MKDQPWEWQSQLTWAHPSASHQRIQHSQVCLCPSPEPSPPCTRAQNQNRVLYVKNSISEEPRQAKPCRTQQRALDREGSKDAQGDLGSSVAKRLSQIQDLCCDPGGTLPRDGSNNSSSVQLINQALPSLPRGLQAQELPALAQPFQLTGSCDPEHARAGAVAAESRVRSRGTTPGQAKEKPRGQQAAGSPSSTHQRLQ